MLVGMCVWCKNELRKRKERAAFWLSSSLSLYTQVRDKVSVKHKARFNYRPLKLLGRDCCKYLPMDSIIPPASNFPEPLLLNCPRWSCAPVLSFPTVFFPALFNSDKAQGHAAGHLLLHDHEKKSCRLLNMIRCLCFVTVDLKSSILILLVLFASFQ